MNSLIISNVKSIAKSSWKKYKASKLGALVENIYNASSKSWQSSAIMNFIKGGDKKDNILSRVIFSPFTFLEFVQRKIGLKLNEGIQKSVFCELGCAYTQAFMAINTRFFGVMLVSASAVYTVLKAITVGGVNKLVLAGGVLGALVLIKRMNIMGFLGGSKLVDFVKACAGVKNITFEFYDEARANSRFAIAGAVITGILTAVGMLVSPIIGLLVPFALFGMLLVLEYPVTGVYAAVFVAPLIPFSSMPLAGVCIWTTISLVLKSVYDKNFKWRREGAGVALILFLGVLFISCIFSFARMSSLVVWAMYFVFVTFYFTVINTIKTRDMLYGLLRLFVISGALVALCGVMQYVFGWTTANAWIDEEMFEEETMRVYSTLANPNVLGEYLLLVLPPALVFFLKDKAKSLSKWVYLGISGVMLLCLILTQSRGCWLGFMATAAIFITFYEGRLWGLVPLVLCAMPFIMPQTIIDRLLSIGDMGDSSTSYRVFIWMGAMGILRNYFIGGIGMGEGAFSQVYPLFSYNAIVAPHAHNTFLQLLVEGGIPALVTFIAVIILVLKGGYKAYRINAKKSTDALMILGLGAGVIGFVVQSMFDYTFYNYRVMAVFFMVLAIVVSFRYLPENTEKEGNE